MTDAVAAWRDRGRLVRWSGHAVFVADVPAVDEQAPPLLLLHGFPTSSFDWRHVVDRLAARRRVIAPDLLGYGLTSKPARLRPMAEQAALVEAVLADAGIDEVDLVTHDMGDTVGGELLARDLDGTLSFHVHRRVLTNGSIYIGDADLRVGQRLLLALPPRRLPIGLPRLMLDRGLTEVFGDAHPPSQEELDAQWALLRARDGDRTMPIAIRYVEERRRSERRFTGAIERHPSPLLVLWGVDDPVALVSMTDRLLEARGDRPTERVLLHDVGHFPMIEVPDVLADHVLDWLDR